MGWYDMPGGLAPGDTPESFLAREFASDPSRPRHGHDGARTHLEVLAAGRAGGVVYLAVRATEPPREAEARAKQYTFCAVCPYSLSRARGFGWKPMTEDMGPLEADPPARVLRLLSPVSEIPRPAFAAAWRARVAERARRRAGLARALRDLTPGRVLRLPRPLRFVPPGASREVEAAEFAVVSASPTRFRALGHGFLCRLPRDALAEALLGPEGGGGDGGGGGPGGRGG